MAAISNPSFIKDVTQPSAPSDPNAKLGPLPETPEDDSRYERSVRRDYSVPGTGPSQPNGTSGVVGAAELLGPPAGALGYERSVHREYSAVPETGPSQPNGSSDLGGTDNIMPEMYDDVEEPYFAVI